MSAIREALAGWPQAHTKQVRTDALASFDCLLATLEEIAACEPSPGEDDVDAHRQLDACIDRMHLMAREALEAARS